MTCRESTGDVTALLRQWSEGTPGARERVILLVYAELRRLAGRALRSERPEHTLQPTDLVHETYQKLVDQRRVCWRDRAHFFALAGRLMRRILVDHARRRRALRRGGGVRTICIDETPPGTCGERDVDLLVLDRALDELSAVDPRQVRLVEMRFFAGLSVVETAEALSVSRATVLREWSMARAWLHRRLTAA